MSSPLKIVPSIGTAKLDVSRSISLQTDAQMTSFFTSFHTDAQNASFFTSFHSDAQNASFMTTASDVEEVTLLCGQKATWQEVIARRRSSYTQILNGGLVLVGLICFLSVAYVAMASMLGTIRSHKMAEDVQVPLNLQVKLASVNFQTPEVTNWDMRAMALKSHLNSFFAGVDIFAMQETKQLGKGGYQYGGDLIVREIQLLILGGGNWKYIVPSQAFADESVDAQKTDCDVSIFYDSSKWQLVTSGSTKTAADEYDIRTVVWGVFRRPSSNSLLAVLNTHGPIGNIKYGYNSQFETIKGVVDKLMSQFASVHIVVLGDFNRPYDNGWSFGHGLDLVKKTNSWGGNFDFDWVFSSPYTSGQVTYGKLKEGAGVCTGVECSAETGSDHKAVLIELEFENSVEDGIPVQIV